MSHLFKSFLLCLKDQNQPALLSPISDCGRDKIMLRRKTNVPSSRGVRAGRAARPRPPLPRIADILLFSAGCYYVLVQMCPYPHRPLSVMPSHPKFHAFSSVWHFLNKEAISSRVSVCNYFEVWSEFSLSHPGYSSLKSLKVRDPYKTHASS